MKLDQKVSDYALGLGVLVANLSLYQLTIVVDHGKVFSKIIMN